MKKPTSKRPYILPSVGYSIFGKVEDISNLQELVNAHDRDLLKRKIEWLKYDLWRAESALRRKPITARNKRGRG